MTHVDDQTMLRMLQEWIPERRWYPLKGVSATFEIVRRFDLGDATILLVRATASDRSALLQVPVAVRETQGQKPIGRIGDAWLVDACYDQRGAAAIVGAATGAVHADGLVGADLGVDAAGAVLRVVTGEQSNTSIIGEGCGRPFIVKLFRVIAAGASPDVVVTTALTATGSTVVPHVQASLEGIWPGDGGDQHGHLAVVSDFVSGAADAWQLFLDDAARAVAGDEHRTPDARALGRAVAEVHTQLADSLGARDAEPRDDEALRTELRARLAWARAEAAEVLGEHDAALDAHDRQLATLANSPQLQYVHGDLHLGQVLLRPDGRFAILDFEGEPLRPLSERFVRQSTLRDVVGMLRSFDYAAGQAALHASGDADASAAVADAWAARMQAEFVAGYGETHEAVDESSLLFRALMLDKALYEVVYELRNRPDWVRVPLAAVGRMLG